MIDTGDTLALATATLHEKGAAAIFVLVSHSTMQSDSPSLKKLSNLPIARLVVTNTLPQTHLMAEVNEAGTVTDGAVVESPISLHHTNGINGDSKLMNGTNGVKGKPKVPGVGEKLTVLDISPLLAESIRRTHNGESISLLFGDWAERAGMAGY